LGTVLNDAQNQGKATFDTAYALATGANPADTGWTITDGKYVWVPYQKVTKANYKKFQ
jgi:methyl-galactoside transport system substrate-binding protein